MRRRGRAGTRRAARPNPSSRSSPSVSWRATGVARRSRASRTRNSAPRHSGSSGSTASAPWSVERLGHLRGRVAGGRERRAKLGVRRLGAGRRRDAVGVLAREMECVPEPAERDLGAHVVEPVGRGGVAVEARERVRELRPKLAHLLGVPLRRRRVRRHSWRLEHCRSLVASRPRNGGADAHCARRRGRRGASHARAREPRARGLRRRRGGDARGGRGGARAAAAGCRAARRPPRRPRDARSARHGCGPRASRSRSSPARSTSTNTATRRTPCSRSRSRRKPSSRSRDGSLGWRREQHAGPLADRLRGAAREVPLRALGGVARGARRREGSLGAGGDRPPLRRPLQPRAARVAARGGGRRPATSASGSTGCARPARAGLSPRSSPSARTSSRTASSRSASRSRARRCRCATRRRSSRCCRATPTARSSDAIQAEASASFNPDRLELMRASEELAADLSGIADAIERNEEEKAISLHELSRALHAASVEATSSYAALRERWFARLLGDEREDVPSSFHTAWMRRLSTLEATYTRDRATEVCLRTLEELGFDLAAQPNIKLDLDDRPQKSPRACVIASDPPKVVHLITRAQGGLHDYQAFLHEAGHALHYAGCDPNAAVRLPAHLARPRADGDLLVHRRGDLARARVARAALRLDAGAGAGERRGDDVPRGAALPPLRGEAALRARLLVAVHRRRRRLATCTSSCSPRRPASATSATTTSPTWTPASTRPTTCVRGSARRSCATT